MSPILNVIETEVKGNIDVTTNSQYNNICADSVTVFENITARFFGIIKNKLVIKKGGRVYMHGKIVGSIENDGGELHKY